MVHIDQIRWGHAPADADYVCTGCEVPVTPCAWNPAKKYKVAPYFAARGEEGHDSLCTSGVDVEIVARAQVARIADSVAGFPLPYPTKLVLPFLERDADDEAGEAASSRKPSRARISREDDGPTTPRTRSSRTIGTICLHYLRYRPNRWEMQLELPGGIAGTYGSIFRHLTDVEELPADKIFYSPMKRQSPPIETDEALVITLSAGKWTGAQQVTPYTLRVKWSTWSKSRREALLREVTRAWQWFRGHYKTGKKSHVFALAAQRLPELNILEVDDWRLIAVLTDSDAEVRTGDEANA